MILRARSPIRADQPKARSGLEGSSASRQRLLPTGRRIPIARDGDSELKVQPERLIQLGDQAGGKAPDHRADAVD